MRADDEHTDRLSLRILAHVIPPKVANPQQHQSLLDQSQDNIAES
jgi:hypothetical protein